MEFKAKQIAELIGGRVEGDENATVNTFAKIEEGKAGAISFLSNPKYTHYIYDTDSTIVLVNEDVELEQPVKATLIRVKNAYECVAKMMQMYAATLPKKTGIDPLAFVSSSSLSQPSPKSRYKNCQRPNVEERGQLICVISQPSSPLLV